MDVSTKKILHMANNKIASLSKDPTPIIHHIDNIHWLKHTSQAYCLFFNSLDRGTPVQMVHRAHALHAPPLICLCIKCTHLQWKRSLDTQTILMFVHEVRFECSHLHLNAHSSPPPDRLQRQILFKIPLFLSLNTFYQLLSITLQIHNLKQKLTQSVKCTSS